MEVYIQLKEKICVVTGAGSGIGRQLAIQLSGHGAIVAGVDYDPNSLAETREMVLAMGGPMSKHVVDVSSREQVFALPEAVLAEHGHVHVIINNAGVIHAHSSIDELPIEQVERVFNINWWGTYFLIKAFLPFLKEAEEAGIVNVSSMGGYMPFPGQVGYGASKAAVKLLTEGLRVELKNDTGIKVCVVYPGAVSTGITENSPDVPEAFKELAREREAEKQVGVSADKAAGKIIRGLERGQTRILVGVDSWFLDKLYRLMPEATASLMAWIMSRVAGVEISGQKENGGKKELAE